MLLEPGDIAIVWHEEVWLIRTQFRAGIQPFMVFDLSVGKEDSAAALHICRFRR